MKIRSGLVTRKHNTPYEKCITSEHVYGDANGDAGVDDDGNDERQQWVHNPT